MTLHTLTPVQARVLGTLMEKARTVPDSYPLSLNALVLGCNQKSSREALMEITDDDARAALQALKQQSLVFEAAASRVPRFEHNFQRAVAVNEPQAVALGLLMLRGPQTAAELRLNGERWYKFADPQVAEDVLQALLQRGNDGGQALVLKLPKMPGAREARWMHLLCGEPDIAALQAAAAAPLRGESDGLLARITALETTVLALRQDNQQLRRHLLSISEPLGITLDDQSPL